jgi:hypothetical protein
MKKRRMKRWSAHGLTKEAWAFWTIHHRLTLDLGRCSDRHVRALLEGGDRDNPDRALIDEIRCRELDAVMVDVPASFRPHVASFLTHARRLCAQRTANAPIDGGSSVAELDVDGPIVITQRLSLKSIRRVLKRRAGAAGIPKRTVSVLGLRARLFMIASKAAGAAPTIRGRRRVGRSPHA